MDEKKLEKLQKLLELADTDYVSSSDFALIINTIIAGIETFRKQTQRELTTSDQAFNKKLDDFIALCERQLQEVNKNSDKQITIFRKELDSEVGKLQDAIDEIESKNENRGTQEELVEKILIRLRGKSNPNLRKEVEKAVAEAIKNIKPNPTVINQGGDWGVPFEIPIKAGTNITVRKDASGAYVISSQSSFTDTFADNEVAAGSGTSFTLAHTPIAGSQHVYANGQRLTPTVDYTISAAAITTVLSWDAGTVIVDYRY